MVNYFQHTNLLLELIFKLEGGADPPPGPVHLGCVLSCSTASCKHNTQPWVVGQVDLGKYGTAAACTNTPFSGGAHVSVLKSSRRLLQKQQRVFVRKSISSPLVGSVSTNPKTLPSHPLFAITAQSNLLVSAHTKYTQGNSGRSGIITGQKATSGWLIAQHSSDKTLPGIRAILSSSARRTSLNGKKQPCVETPRTPRCKVKIHQQARGNCRAGGTG